MVISNTTFRSARSRTTISTDTVWFVQWGQTAEKKLQTCSWRDSSTVFSLLYEVSWQVMKRKGQGGCAFIHSKPIGQISTFHATTLWLQLLPFWLKQYIHLGHSYIISPLLHLIANVTQRAGRYYRIDLLQRTIHSLIWYQWHVM